MVLIVLNIGEHNSDRIGVKPWIWRRSVMGLAADDDDDGGGGGGGMLKLHLTHG